MNNNIIRFLVITSIVFAILFVSLLIGNLKENKDLSFSSSSSRESFCSDITIKEVFSTSYSNHLYETGFPIPDVCWEYITGPDRLETLEADYDFDYPDNLEFDKYSYVVSFGCQILSCWIDEMVGDEHILNIIYNPEFQGKKVFLYQIPKTQIYPLQWPSYIIKDGEKLKIATTPTDCNKSLLDGYKFHVDFPMEEMYNTSFSALLIETENLSADNCFEYICEEEELEALSKQYEFQYPDTLDFNIHSYLISFGYKTLGCWSEKIEDGEYILNISKVSEFVGNQVFFYQFPKFIQGK